MASRSQGDATGVAIIVGILLQAAYTRSTIIYATLGRLVSHDTTLPSGRRELGELLDAVGTYSMDRWGIALSVLVVGKSTGLPSGRSDPANPGGFYEWAAERGFDISDPEKLVHEQTRKAFNTVGALAAHR